MKFASIAVAITLAASASAFAPNAGISSTRVATTNSPLSDIVSTSPVATSTRNTELNLFGLKTLKAKVFNSSAKASGDITEKEVRALFELWNSALATGDSRIVASRYTKVSHLIVCQGNAVWSGLRPEHLCYMPSH